MSVRTRRPLVLALTLLVATVLGITASVQASSPTSGTVSDTSRTTSWGGGPFVTPNVTGGVTDAPDCTVPGSCDDCALTVDTPAGYGTAHSLPIKVSWADTAADFDVYLIDATGNTVATAASSADPEEHDAEANCEGGGYRGRWAIRESGSRDGETVVQVLATPAS